MDANGLRFWMLSTRDDWRLPSASGLQYCERTDRLQLLSASAAPPPAEDRALAAAHVERAPLARDRFDNYARWDPSTGHVVAGGSGPGEVPIYTPPPLEDVTDLVLGEDGVLYVAVAGDLVLIDRRERWPNATLRVPGFTFWRLAVHAGGGVLALDRANAQLGRVVGAPLPAGPRDTREPGILAPCDVNPDPPRMSERYALPAGETFIGLTAMAGPEFALASWGGAVADTGIAYVRTFDETSGPSAPVTLRGVRWPYAVAWIGERRLAVLATNAREAFVYDLAVAHGSAAPAGDAYVLAGENLGPFVHGFELPASYADARVSPPAILPLLPLSLNSFTPAGASDPASPAIFDAGAAMAVWHRLFVEAILPPRCGCVVWLAASDAASDLTSSATTWYPHAFGDASLAGVGTAVIPDVPRGVWQSMLPEVPFAPSLLNAQPVRNRQGLFMTLIQRAGKAVRTLRGRYLGVRVTLNGDGRSTPEIAALRAYASRFSYVEHYLPAIYREDAFGAEAELDGASTRRDFFERFVDGFEAQLTRIEDRVASAYLLTRAECAPDDALEWLGAWVGVEPSNYPPARRRARLQATPSLHRERGTARGVTLALDVATDGMCARGAVIVIEDFRLRHIFATILGADLSSANDPLLPGRSPQSNSVVGDTLFLGDPRLQGEVQALFATDLRLPGGAAQPPAALFDALANRMTVFVHDQVEAVDAALVQRVVEREKPAHVAARLQRASQALMIGLASLVGIDTYLAPEPPRETATVGVSEIGRWDVVQNPASLDPRLENGGTPNAQPLARVLGPAFVLQGDTVILEGGATAPPGRRIVSYTWTLVPPPSPSL